MGLVDGVQTGRGELEERPAAADRSSWRKREAVLSRGVHLGGTGRALCYAFLRVLISASPMSPRCVESTLRE